MRRGGEAPPLGETFQFLVLRIHGRNAVFSRRAWIASERTRELGVLHAASTRQSRVNGTVTRVERYGAFVSFKWVTGLLHVSELADRFVAHPNEVVRVGDKVSVLVLGVEPDGRISLRLQ